MVASLNQPNIVIRMVDNGVDNSEKRKSYTEFWP